MSFCSSLLQGTSRTDSANDRSSLIDAEGAHEFTALVARHYFRHPKSSHPTPHETPPNCLRQPALQGLQGLIASGPVHHIQDWYGDPGVVAGHEHHINSNDLACFKMPWKN